MLKRVRPSVWLPAIMVAWGIVMTLMGIVHNFAGLLSARIFLGVTEAGLFPGVAYYLTNWYKRDEIQLRQAMFFSAASVAGAFSGLLAFAIGKMDGVAGLHGWQWIFILEGTWCCIIRLGSRQLLTGLHRDCYHHRCRRSLLCALRLPRDGWLPHRGGAGFCRVPPQVPRPERRSEPYPGCPGRRVQVGVCQGCVPRLADLGQPLCLLGCKQSPNHVLRRLKLSYDRLSAPFTASLSSCPPSSASWATKAVKPSS